MPTPTTLEIELGGRTLTLETGKLAGLAGGAVTVRYGDSLVLGTANRSEPRPGLDFFPLTVDFEERMYAAGKIPGGFIKREGRSSEQAILAARLTDRPIRPLFPEGYKDDVQIVITVMSTDQENDPDILGTIAASAALTISEIPFQGPVGAVRIGRIDGEGGEAQRAAALRPKVQRSRFSTCRSKRQQTCVMQSSPPAVRPKPSAATSPTVPKSMRLSLKLKASWVRSTCW